ncbi:MAG: ExbD/TolR family protein [Myxococcota bacterium]|nr:biopolymer transporter ExbD [Myxococcota bacterium]
MAGTQQRDSGIISGINVTPLVDITLVLLVIFIVTAKIIVTPAVHLDLPAAKSTEEHEVVLSIIIPKEGPTLVNGVTVAGDEALMGAARAVHDADPSARAVISADGDVPHRTMLHVLDLLKQSGFSAIAFAARPLETTP